MVSENAKAWIRALKIIVGAFLLMLSAQSAKLPGAKTLKESLANLTALLICLLPGIWLLISGIRRPK
jgi:hypothetical protein